MQVNGFKVNYLESSFCLIRRYRHTFVADLHILFSNPQLSFSIILAKIERELIKLIGFASLPNRFQ